MNRYCLALWVVFTLTTDIGRATAAAPLSPSDVVERLQTRFDRLQDYECVMRTETRSSSKVEAAAFRIWYRRPGLLRLRVLQGRHRRSELLLGADGVLRGRRGGILRPFSRRLSRSDPDLRSLRGQPAWEVDFSSFLKAMRQRIALPGSSTSLRQPTSSQPHLLLEVRYQPTGSDRTLRDIWTIDPQEWLLVSGDIFDGETRVDHFEFSDVQIDRGLKESWFRF